MKRLELLFKKEKTSAVWILDPELPSKTISTVKTAIAARFLCCLWMNFHDFHLLFVLLCNFACFLLIQRGRGDICASMSQYGHGKGTTQGGFSELSAVKAKYCYKLKTNISFLDAVLLEPMGKFSAYRN